MHFPHFNVPIFYFKPFVVTIHDLILRHFKTRRASKLGPIIYWVKNLAYRIVIWLAIWRAKKIIAVSYYVKEDIIKCFGINQEKIVVTYEGVPQRIYSREMVDSDLGKQGIHKPYLLYVGNAYPHKNLENLIEAYKILKDNFSRDLQLVLVGEDDYFYKRLRNEIFSIFPNDAAVNQIILTDFVPDEELVSLYIRASLYVFPSLCEGFGLPALEAMTYGVPVASSSATSLPEVLGEAAVYFDALDCKDMAQKIARVLGDENLQQKLTSAGYEQIKKYSWEKMARETLQVYRDAIGYRQK